MSRHRFVRNLTEDDYYDDYDDDYDDYYEEQGYSSYNSPSKSKKQTKTQQKQAAKQPTAKQQQPTKQASASSVKAPAKSPSTTVSVSKPPPGWGKPTTPSVATTIASKQPTSKGVSSPPPGWGKPVTTPSAGISKPPAGWGKPQQQQQPSSSNDAGISKPPPGWGKPKDTKTSNIPAAASSVKNAGAASSHPVPPILLQESSKKKHSQLSMVVLGHVDAGKSTLMGQLLYQLGHVSKRQAQKISGISHNNNENNNQSIQWAWLLDEDETEREHGVTMEVATKSISTENHQLVILDAPGHADFIPMMITGTASADVGLLVVDAGEFLTAFESGQTKEHVLLARGLGVSQLLVAINKLDMQDWSQQIYQHIQQQLLPFLTKQANFAPKRIRFIPTSGLTGINITASSSSSSPKLKSWYKGPSLLEAINTFQPAKHGSIEKPLRMILTDVYSEGKHVGARGRIVQGFVGVGERLVLLPLGDETAVVGLQHLQELPSDDTNRSQYAVAGDAIDITLSGLDIVRVSVGNLLSRTSLQQRPSIRKKCRAKILLMDQLQIPIIRGNQVLFHIHSLDIPAVLSNLISVTSKRDGKTKERPRALTAGASAVVEITLSAKICMEAFNDCRALGRFVLRRSGATIAVGIIEGVL